jgi:hypothetical protein
MANNCYRKSTLTALNTTAQAFVTAGTILSPGGQLEKTGCSLTTSLQGIRILSDGLYTASGAVALYKDGNLLPCSVRTMNANSGVLYMLDAIAPAFEGEACRVIHPEITVQISGVDGSVSRVCLNVTRLA